jgi:hypothetical protein
MMLHMLYEVVLQAATLTTNSVDVLCVLLTRAYCPRERRARKNTLRVEMERQNPGHYDIRSQPLPNERGQKLGTGNVTCYC